MDDKSSKYVSHAGAMPAMVTEILARIERFSAQKRAGGREALQQSVSFNFLNAASAAKRRGFLQRLSSKSAGTKEDKVAWLVGPLAHQPTTSIYIDRDGNAYLVPLSDAPRVPSDVTLMTREKLNTMTFTELESVRNLLRRPTA